LADWSLKRSTRSRLPHTLARVMENAADQREYAPKEQVLAADNTV